MDCDQKLNWEKLESGINECFSRLNDDTVSEIAVELFQWNLLRGKWIFAQAVCAGGKPQPLASIIDIISSKLPSVGKCAVEMLVVAAREAFFADNVQLLDLVKTIGYLFRHHIVHEVVILELLMVLVSTPTEDSLKVVYELLSIVGGELRQVSPVACGMVLGKLQELGAEIPTVFKELGDFDMVEDEERTLHLVRLDVEVEVGGFVEDEKFEENEHAYEDFKRELFGEEATTVSVTEALAAVDGISGERESVGPIDTSAATPVPAAPVPAVPTIDMTNAQEIEFSKKIYLVLKGSMSEHEAVHKLIKLNIPNKFKEKAVEIMVKSCSQEQTYSKFYGNAAEKLCSYKAWQIAFSNAFKTIYNTIETFETNQLRNVGKFWGHILASDVLGLEVFQVVHLNEQESTAASRVYLKFVFQELVADLGVDELKRRLEDSFVREFLTGVFPVEDADDLRFSINYFTAIGLGILTETMRQRLNSVVEKEKMLRGRSRSVSRERYSSREREYSKTGREGERSRTPPRRYGRSRSPPRRYARSRTPPRRYARSRTPPRQRERSRTPPRQRERSRTPPRQRERSRTPPRQRERSRTLPRQRERSRTPPRQRERSRTPPRQRERSRTPPRRYARSRTPPRRYAKSPRRDRTPPRQRYRS